MGVRLWCCFTLALLCPTMSPGLSLGMAGTVGHALGMPMGLIM